MVANTKSLDPCIFVIFGATGDLTHRKLIPAFYRLHLKNELPKNFVIVGVARKDKSHDEFRLDVKKSMNDFLTKTKLDKADEFFSKVFYYKNNFDTEEAYDGLNEFLKKLDKLCGIEGNRIFYLATLPDKFEPIIKNLRKYKFLKKGYDYKLIIEKPFGDDLNSARKLNKIINLAFKEEQIFRIDHYLGKEAVQNLFALRFANRIFEPAWDNKNIDNIQITATEDISIGTRGGFYDKYGAIKDVVQNHLMQILSLIAMEAPKNFNPCEVKYNKVKVLKELVIPKKKDIILGQYKKGSLKDSRDYTNEEGVKKNSRTETFVALKLNIKNKR
ncbi:MAG: glucose-6-phosphate dehydrogenase, partial [Nanoarchaeota archaeon]